MNSTQTKTMKALKKRLIHEIYEVQSDIIHISRELEDRQSKLVMLQTEVDCVKAVMKIAKKASKVKNLYQEVKMKQDDEEQEKQEKEEEEEEEEEEEQEWRRGKRQLDYDDDDEEWQEGDEQCDDEEDEEGDDEGEQVKEEETRNEIMAKVVLPLKEVKPHCMITRAKSRRL